MIKPLKKGGIYSEKREVVIKKIFLIASADGIKGIRLCPLKMKPS